MLKPGANVLKLIVPAGPINNGVIYDYVRLELDDPGAATAASPATLFIAGDSTAADGAPARSAGVGTSGGSSTRRGSRSSTSPAGAGAAGRSSRRGCGTVCSSGVKVGDLVLIQFGHNDGGPINDDRRARGSIPGTGDESKEIDNLLTKKHEVIHTFGWYLRKMVAETKAKGATPIVLSLTVRDIWKEGRVERGSGRFGEWARDRRAVAGGALRQPDDAGRRPL